METIAFYLDSFVTRKINVEQKVAENWAHLLVYFFATLVMATRLRSLLRKHSADSRYISLICSATNSGFAQRKHQLLKGPEEPMQ